MVNPMKSPDEQPPHYVQHTIIDPKDKKSLHPEDEITLMDLKKGVDLDEDENEEL